MEQSNVWFRKLLIGAVCLDVASSLVVPGIHAGEPGAGGAEEKQRAAKGITVTVPALLERYKAAPKGAPIRAWCVGRLHDQLVVHLPQMPKVPLEIMCEYARPAEPCMIACKAEDGACVEASSLCVLDLDDAGFLRVRSAFFRVSREAVTIEQAFAHHPVLREALSGDGGEDQIRTSRHYGRCQRRAEEGRAREGCTPAAGAAV